MSWRWDGGLVLSAKLDGSERYVEWLQLRDSWHKGRKILNCRFRLRCFPSICTCYVYWVMGAYKSYDEYFSCMRWLCSTYSCYVSLFYHSLFIVCSLYTPGAHYLLSRLPLPLLFLMSSCACVVLAAAQLGVKNFRRESFKNSGMTCNTYRFSWLGTCHHS